METITTTFEEVSIRRWKSGKCITCGKRRRRVKKFWQTLSPFNTKPDGTVKSPSDIREEIAAEARAWEDKPIDCCG